eukprot:3015834-Prorocentrum_lima.AAC.1
MIDKSEYTNESEVFRRRTSACVKRQERRTLTTDTMPQRMTGVVKEPSGATIRCLCGGVKH